MGRIIQTTDRWFPVITRRGAILLSFLESAAYGEKLLDFTGLDLTGYKEIRVVKDNEYTLFLEGQSWGKVEQIFRERLVKEQKYLSKIFKKFYPWVQKITKLAAPTDLAKLPDSKLAKLFLTYADLYTDVAPFYIVYYATRPILKKKTESWLKERLPETKLQEYHITLTTPLARPYLVEEDSALTKIVKSIRSNKRASKFFGEDLQVVRQRLPVKFPKIHRQIKRHLKAYYWVPVERDSQPWKLHDILGRIQTWLKQPPKRKVEVKLYEKQKRYERGLRIPQDTLAVFKDLRELMRAVDSMKRAFAISHCFLSDLLAEASKRLRLDRDILYFLTPAEIAGWLTGKQSVPREEFAERIRCIVIGHRVKGDWRVEVIKGAQSEEVITRLSQPQEVEEAGKEALIKGTPASPGKARGVVKVLKDASELDKLSQDDILVTGMTTPDYIVAIHKASAIVTDEGGILSHAAIISREFGIPCVIGTRIATQVLKDRDFVEVDAEEGIVRKI